MYKLNIPLSVSNVMLIQMQMHMYSQHTCKKHGYKHISYPTVVCGESVWAVLCGPLTKTVALCARCNFAILVFVEWHPLSVKVTLVNTILLCVVYVSCVRVCAAIEHEFSTNAHDGSSNIALIK